MTTEPPCVTELVGRFHLRGRANQREYLSGRGLAEAGAVQVVTIESECVVLAVADGNRYEVTLRVVRGNLTGWCSCGGSHRQVCRHQVAAEHALWQAS